jgi:hypothetical protein
MFAWVVVWALVLRAFGIAAFSRTLEGRAARRNRLQRMGKLLYVIIFGLTGVGPAFGLGMTVAGELDHASHNWISPIAKFLLLSLFMGLFYGLKTWTESIREPVPYPPIYPPMK